MSNNVALVLVVAMHVAVGVVLVLMVTRRGWWKPTGDELDWTTTADCPRCNEHGPYPGWDAKVIASEERARNLHQAWHEVASVLLTPVTRLLERTGAGS